MNQMHVSRYDVYQEYMRRAISFLDMGRTLGQHDSFFWNTGFFYSIALELGCKSYLLYHRGSEFETLPFQKLKVKVNKTASEYGHHLTKMVQEIKKMSVIEELGSITSQEFRSSKNCILNGSAITKILEACYWEARYPMPTSIVDKYPIPGEKDMYFNVTIDAHLEFFVGNFLSLIKREIRYKEKGRLSSLKRKQRRGQS